MREKKAESYIGWVERERREDKAEERGCGEKEESQRMWGG